MTKLSDRVVRKLAVSRPGVQAVVEAPGTGSVLGIYVAKLDR